LKDIEFKEIKNTPNTITLSRILFAVLTIYFVNHPARYLFFGLMIVSDGLDGFIARKMNQETKLGQILDPAVDKAVAGLIFLSLFSKTAIPYFFILLFFSREIFEGIVGIVHIVKPLSEDIEIKARFPGKIVTNLQFITLIALLIPSTTAVKTLILGVFITSAWATADYTSLLLKNHQIALNPKKRRSYSYLISLSVFGLVAILLLPEIYSTLQIIPFT
jgi:CDP-diacylglycerol--glycerol-3-phosphate 3-phosphatidyltransferase